MDETQQPSPPAPFAPHVQQLVSLMLDALPANWETARFSVEWFTPGEDGVRMTIFYTTAAKQTESSALGWKASPFVPVLNDVVREFAQLQKPPPRTLILRVAASGCFKVDFGY